MNSLLTSDLVQFLISQDLQPLQVLQSCDRSVILEVSCSRFKPSLTSVVRVFQPKVFQSAEPSCLSVCQHPNIVGLKRTLNFQNFEIVEMEKVEGVPLIEIIKQRKLSENEARQVMVQLINALQSVHQNGWAHRDVKPDNVLVNLSTGKVTLIDFEMAGKINNNHKNKLCRFFGKKSKNQSVGTLEFSSPEIRSGKSYVGPEVDVWSLGVSLFAMLSQLFPFHSQDLILGEETLVFPERLAWTTQSVDLMTKMMDKDPKTRLKSQDLLKHEWFSM